MAQRKSMETADSSVILLSEHFHEPEKLPSEKLKKQVARIKFIYEQFRIEGQPKAKTLKRATELFAIGYQTALRDFNIMMLIFGESLTANRNVYGEMIFDELMEHAYNLKQQLKEMPDAKTYTQLAKVYTTTLAAASKHAEAFFPDADSDKYRNLEIRPIIVQTDPRILGIDEPSKLEAEKTARKYLEKYNLQLPLGRLKDQQFHDGE